MYSHIWINCKGDFTPDFLRQLANTIEMQEEQKNFNFTTENGKAEVIYQKDC